MRIIQFLAQNNVIIFFGSISLYWSGQMMLGPNFSPIMNKYTFITGLSSYLIYSLPRLKFTFNSKLGDSVKLVLYAIIMLIDTGLILSLHVGEQIFIFHLGLISLLYNFPFKTPNKFLPVRIVPFIKIFLISYVWASIGSIWSLYGLGSEYNQSVFYIFIVQFLFIFSITIPFDIRDYTIDKELRIKTLPGIIGINASKYLAIFTLILFVLLGSLLTNFSQYTFIFIGLPIIGLIIKSNEYRNELYYTGLIDGYIIIYALILYLVYR